MTSSVEPASQFCDLKLYWLLGYNTSL